MAEVHGMIIEITQDSVKVKRALENCQGKLTQCWGDLHRNLLPFKGSNNTLRANYVKQSYRQL